MTKDQHLQKRIFDLFFAGMGLIFLGWFIVCCAGIAFFDTTISGFYKSKRIGKNGKAFWMWKIRSMHKIEGHDTHVTTHHDPRISKIGRFWRKTKIDELPQLWNVLIGNMSFVGPRPDVPGFADKLEGDDRILLSIRPGITGPASLKFKNEEQVLAKQEHPETYNQELIWPEKVHINKKYIQNHSLLNDIKIILKTVLG